jgi:peptidoglycan hydrolase-like protein with peptidoglycan-binding domain
MTNKGSNIGASTRPLAILGMLGATLMVLCAPSIASAATLDRQLDIGMSGADVTALQTFLATDPSIYPQGLVTGYFGTLTSAAVSNFQSKNGIDNVGRVGPITLTALNMRMTGVMGDVSAPTIANVAVQRTANTATISWYTAESSRGVVYYSATPLTTYERPHTVDVSGNTAMMNTGLNNAQNVFISGLTANTVYYYLIYVTDASGNVSITLPSSFQTAN